jgi:hypothetical protein
MRDLMLPSDGGALQNLGFASIQLQPVRHRRLHHIVDAGGGLF